MKTRSQEHFSPWPVSTDQLHKLNGQSKDYKGVAISNTGIKSFKNHPLFVANQRKIYSFVAA
jgi:hypothetical protein